MCVNYIFCIESINAMIDQIMEGCTFAFSKAKILTFVRKFNGNFDILYIA